MKPKKEKADGEKVKPLSVVASAVARDRKEGKTVVTTNGCFDIIHIGHIRYLEDAKKLGEVLVVGINSDASVRANKGKNRPIISENERAEVIASLKAVDYVFIFPEKTPHAWLSKIRPHIHVKGGDYTHSEIAEAVVVEKYGGKVVTVPVVREKSTTNIIGKIVKKHASR